MSEFHITIASERDRKKLTEIAFRAKRHWKYPEEWIELWSDDLSISAQYIRNHFVFKAIDESQHSIIGFCAIEYHKEDQKLEIAHAWVLPPYMGKNIGTTKNGWGSFLQRILGLFPFIIIGLNKK